MIAADISEFAVGAFHQPRQFFSSTRLNWPDSIHKPQQRVSNRRHSDSSSHNQKAGRMLARMEPRLVRRNMSRHATLFNAGRRKGTWLRDPKLANTMVGARQAYVWLAFIQPTKIRHVQNFSLRPSDIAYFSGILHCSLRLTFGAGLQPESTRTDVHG